MTQPNVIEAKEIISQYAQKCSTVDEGNLYFAATQIESAYDQLVKEKDQLEEAILGYKQRETELGMKLEDRDRLLAKAKENLALALSFAPKGPVPVGLSPEFYHTLDYGEELKLQSRIDSARAFLKELETKE